MLFRSDKATHFRSLALTEADLILSGDPEEKDTLMLMREDLLRRLGRFEQLIEEYSGITFGDPLFDAINAFQIEKAKEGDIGCYTVRDAVSEEEDDDVYDGHGEHDNCYIDSDDLDDDYDLSADEDLPEWLSMWINSIDSEIVEFDHDCLQRFGISFESLEDEIKFLGYVNEDLQVRVGEKISADMPEELLEEYDSIVDPYEAAHFLEENCPDYGRIILRCIWEITCELIRYSDMIPGADIAGIPPVMEYDTSELGLDEKIISILRDDGIETVGSIVMTDLSELKGLSLDDTDLIATSVLHLLMPVQPEPRDIWGL